LPWFSGVPLALPIFASTNTVREIVVLTLLFYKKGVTF